MAPPLRNIRVMPGLRSRLGGPRRVWWMAVATSARPRAGTAMPGRDDLGGDGQRGLLRGARAEVEADRGVQVRDLGVGETCFAQPLGASGAGAPRAHGPDVGDRQPQGLDQQRDVELGVVGEHRDDRARINAGGLQVAVRPGDHDVVGLGEAAARGEHRPGVADGDVVAQVLPDAHQGARTPRPRRSLLTRCPAPCRRRPRPAPRRVRAVRCPSPRPPRRARRACRRRARRAAPR